MNDRLRILQVSSHFPPLHRGGAERVCFELSDALARVGHHVVVAAPVLTRREKAFDVRSLPARGGRPIGKILFDYWNAASSSALMAAITAVQPDVVHFHNTYNIGSHLIRVASGLRPTIVTLHDYSTIDLVGPSYRHGRLRYPARDVALRPWTYIHRRIHGANLRRATLVSPSRFLAERVGLRLGIPVVVVPNAFPAPVESAVRNPSILFVGRLVEEKGIACALSYALEAARNAGWSVAVVGDGPQLAQLRQRHPDVVWHGSRDPGPFYRSSSILAVPSVWPENAPMVVLEGMAHGIAVLASSAGGIPELINDAVDGSLFKPGDWAEFRRSLDKLIGDEKRRRKLGDRARERAASLGWDLVAEKYFGIYEAAIAGAFVDRRHPAKEVAYVQDRL